MTLKRSDLLSEALQLPAEERALLAQQLLDSVRDRDFESDEIAQAWADEIRSRIEDLRSGIQLVSWDDLHAELVAIEQAHAG